MLLWALLAAGQITMRKVDGCVSRVVEILLSRPPSGLICA
jgi:hypothetical protein